MFDYSRLVTIAADKIQYFGQQVAIARKVQTGYDVDTSNAVTTESVYTTYGVIDTYKLSDIDGTIVQRDDIMLITPAPNSADISVNDVVTINNIKYTVVNVNTVSPSGTPIIFLCQLRR